MRLVAGNYYELPNKTIAYAYGFSGKDALHVMYFCDEDGNSWKQSQCYVLKFYKHRPDLQDWPNAKDPKLPYEFDLHWDIKRVSQLKEALKYEPTDSYLYELIDRYEIKV